MMRLMNDAIETEAHQAQRADNDAIKLIEAAIFSEKPVSRFVQTNESAVHQMADNKNKRDRQPDQSAAAPLLRALFQRTAAENEKLKRTAHHPVRHLAAILRR